MDARQQRRIESVVVILLTFILFTIALFVHGFTKDLLLEAGVFLVSVKLILMSSKNAQVVERIEKKLDQIHAEEQDLKQLIEDSKVA